MIEPPEPLDPEALVGTVLGSYQLVRLIGSGGMGWVFEGLQPIIGARVAIKVLDPEVAGSPGVVERFFNEARAVNVVGHRNLVRVLDLGQDHGRYYTVMELLEGRPLSALLAERGPMTFAEAAPILLQCADALQAAHARGIVHRDVKPDNIFLAAGEGGAPSVKIIDFGVAKLASAKPGDQRTAVGVVMGSPAYMSPEQAEGAGDVDGRSDVYSLGVVMFQVATGRLPFSEPSQVRTLMAHVTAPPPRPMELAPDTQPGFEEIIVRCLAKAPQDRFQSMGELREALAAALEAMGLAPAARPAPAPRPEATPPGPAAPVLPASVPPAPPAIPAYGCGAPGEPLPGAEMLEAGSAATLRRREASRADTVKQAPLELDLSRAAPPSAAPAEAEATVERPAPGEARRPGAARRPEPWKLLLGLALLACAAAAAAHLLLGIDLSPWRRRERSWIEIAAGPDAAPGAGGGGAGCPAGTRPAAKAGTVELQVLTTPAGAQVLATWAPAGCDGGVTPWRFRVPRGARVRLRYRLQGRPDRETVVSADGAQAILESLSP